VSPTLTCASGDVTNEDGATVPSPLNVIESFTGITPASAAAGITANAYVGQATVAMGGSFCALGFAGGSVSLADPNSCNVSTSVPIPLGSSTPTCGGGACADGGAVAFSCP
jgi:hypothetical protein